MRALERNEAAAPGRMECMKHTCAGGEAQEKIEGNDLHFLMISYIIFFVASDVSA